MTSWTWAKKSIFDPKKTFSAFQNERITHKCMTDSHYWHRDISKRVSLQNFLKNRAFWPWSPRRGETWRMGRLKSTVNISEVQSYIWTLLEFFSRLFSFEYVFLFVFVKHNFCSKIMKLINRFSRPKKIEFASKFQKLNDWCSKMLIHRKIHHSSWNQFPVAFEKNHMWTKYSSSFHFY